MPIDEEDSRLLFQVVTNTYKKRCIVYTTSIEFSGWGRVFGDPNMAAAIIDRMVHHGRMIRFEGEAQRRTHALMEQGKDRESGEDRKQWRNQRSPGRNSADTHLTKHRP